MSILVACALAALIVCAGSATAATVTLMGRHGHSRQINNRFLNGAALAPVAIPGAAASAPVNVSASSKKPKPKRKPITVRSRLAKMRRYHRITKASYATYLAEWNNALKEERHLVAWRSEQLADVTILIHDIAVSHKLTRGRLPVLFLTLARNAQYWRYGDWLDYPDRVQFKGSELVWEYYPGYGLQLQINGTFGEADGYYEYGKADWGKLTKVLAEMRPLAVNRGGGLAWEYYFDWEGGSPPWVSAMAEGTALEAFSNAYKATKNRGYLREAHKLLPLLTTPPPTGVGEKTARGIRYLQYSFAPTTYIINAFMQTLIGLDHYARTSGSRAALKLFNEGSAEAKFELPSFVAVGWSLYEPGELDDYGYHVLVTGFAQQLCSLTTAPVYCTTYDKFESDLTTSPKISQLTMQVASEKEFDLRFRLSKVANVGAVVRTKGKDYLYTSAQFASGVRSFLVPKLPRGNFTVTLTATDLAGNRKQIQGTLLSCKKDKCST